MDCFQFKLQLASEILHPSLDNYIKKKLKSRVKMFLRRSCTAKMFLRRCYSTFSSRPLRDCVVASGPAGFYTAKKVQC
ncbi:hypothetical protein DCAR_0100274 [Daucus carota subsp. sativus]|uniref:Uncharacterized protein n=1 Tax=Daucus carota subsp. sativus TaxID=79200 RepID=A0A166FJ87_DAUCS|nr:hypothetical protein DCAR_0100274 [Daucus carota subsp. sativus]